MEALAHKLAVRIHETQAVPTSIAVLANGLTYILMSTVIVGTTLLVGLCTGRLLEAVIVLLAFSTLRRFSGGRHLKTINQCVVLTTSLMVMLSHLNFQSLYAVTILNGCSLIVVILFAPSFLKDGRQLSRKTIGIMKVVSVLLVCSNFYFQSGTIAAAFFAQAVLLIPTERRKNIYE